MVTYSLILLGHRSTCCCCTLTLTSLTISVCRVCGTCSCLFTTIPFFTAAINISAGVKGKIIHEDSKLIEKDHIGDLNDMLKVEKMVN